MDIREIKIQIALGLMRQCSKCKLVKMINKHSFPPICYGEKCVNCVNGFYFANAIEEKNGEAFNLTGPMMSD